MSSTTAPAKLFVNTGSPQFGRPSMGAWITYGIGSESKDLPGFVVLQSGPRGPRGGAALYASGFLPTTFQGVPFRGTGEPILDLTSPKGISRERQRDVIDTVRDLNAARLAETGDPEIATRIAAYEMAYRMQTSAPELIDIAKEDQKTLDRLRGSAGQALVCEQLPSGPTARGTRRALRAALSHRLGPSWRTDGEPDDGSRPGMPRSRSGRAPPLSTI